MKLDWTEIYKKILPGDFVIPAWKTEKLMRAYAAT
jgi:hypothetical protein